MADALVTPNIKFKIAFWFKEYTFLFIILLQPPTSTQWLIQSGKVSTACKGIKNNINAGNGYASWRGTAFDLRILVNVELPATIIFMYHYDWRGPWTAAWVVDVMF